MSNRYNYGHRRSLLALSAALAVLTIGLAACGDDDGSSADDGDDGARVFTGSFEVVDDAEGVGPVTGTAELVVSDSGTTAEIQLADLEPDTAYASHLHAGACDQPDPGGPHFKFDLDGPDTPPNEIHLPFTTNADGEGLAEATNEQAVPDPETRSIVVHLASEEDHSGGHDDSSGSGEKEHSDDEMHGEDEEMHGDGDMKEGESEHGDGTGHTHQPKLACAQFG
jgi:Cu-Zn family superoxide dismutase